VALSGLGAGVAGAAPLGVFKGGDSGITFAGFFFIKYPIKVFTVLTALVEPTARLF
jgi:hypothetical protein